jgi:gas vesicle protein
MLVEFDAREEGCGMMKENRRRGGLRTFLAFTLGAAVGGIVALLYAPASGQVTRRRIALKIRTLRRDAVRRLGRTQRALATRALQVREAAGEWIADRLPHRNGNGRHLVRRRVRHAAAH